jgi:DNA-binding CsgD family transcriptional regulator
MPTLDAARPGSLESLKSAAESARMLHDRQEFVEPWVRRCEAFANSEGFRYFVFGLVVPRLEGRALQLILTNYPRDWVTIYDNFEYIRLDPVAAQLQTSISPFSWDELPVVGAKVKTFWKRASRFGLRHGYSVPVHGPRGQHAVLCISGSEGPMPAEGRKERFARTWTFAIQLLEEVFGPLLGSDTAGVRPLMLKQRVALSLIARGYSIREIAETLGLHQRTVEYHLRSALQRLGAVTREQAIVRALVTGDIDEVNYPGRLRDWCWKTATD